MNPFPVGQKAEGVAASHEEPQGESRIFPGNTGERHGQAARSHRKEAQQRRGSAGILPLPGKGHGHTYRFSNG